MASVQQQQLTALQALLAAGGTVAGARVYLDRVDPIPPADLPAITIEEDGERMDTIDLDGNQQRESAILVHCILAATSTAPADARAFGLAVEKLIAASSTLAALAPDGVAIASSKTEINGEGDRLLASRDQTWLMSYRVDPTTPDVIVT